jgi:pimeloyl-ACP methyl ester carboxylesterase
MTMVAANGWTFDCEIVGTGPDIVFIHGEIHGTAYWEHQVAEFAKNYRCLTYHRRGHSKTGASGGGYDLTSQRRDLEQLIAHFGIVRPVIVAVAFGTTIAADYAIHHPDDVATIMMVAWSELHEARKYFDRWVEANKRVVAVLQEGGRAALVEFLRQEAGHSLYMVIPTEGPLREPCIQLFADHPVEAYARGMLEFANSVPDLIAPFSKLDVPVRGICGALDPFPDQPEVLSAMKNFREFTPIAGASRFVQWEKPTEFNTLLGKILSAVAPTTEN